MFSSKTATSNLAKHLESEHNILDTVAIQRTSSRTMQSFFNPIVRTDTSITDTMRKRKLVCDIALLCCRDSYPFDLVDGEGMFDFCKVSCHYIIKSISTQNAYFERHFMFCN